MTLEVITQRPHRLIGPEMGGKPGEGGILVDAVLEESVDLEASITSHPIELGADIHDHIVVEPTVYFIRAAVTNTPSDYEGTEYNHAESRTRALSALAILRDLYLNREPFDVRDGLLFHENMVIRKIHSKRDPGNDGGVYFEVTLQEVRIIQTQTITRPPEAFEEGGVAEAELRTKQDRGEVAPKPATTFLKKLINLGTS